MTTSLIITSSRFLSDLGKRELGHLPIAFRPLGVNALYERIVESFDCALDAVFMTIPKGFRCPENHMKCIDRCGITLVEVDDDLDVGEAIRKGAQAALTRCGPESDLIVCYGDALLYGPSIKNLPPDFISIIKPKYCHNWGIVSCDEGHLKIRHNPFPQKSEMVASGLFRFSSAKRLMDHLVKAKNIWFDALPRYHREVPFALEHIEGLLDLGEHSGYNYGQRISMQPRVFNRMSNDGEFVKKLSKDCKKMASEYQWFENLPQKMKIHVPVVADYRPATTCGGESGYSIQYLPLQTISNVLVFGALPSYAWERIFESCDAVLNDFHKFYRENGPALNPRSVFSALIVKKTWIRVNKLTECLGITGHEAIRYGGTMMHSVRELTSQLLNRIPETTADQLSIMHGDFCGSNILFNAVDGSIRVIDPRGFYAEDQNTIYGDRRYDIAKLAHSILGAYDSIIAGHVETHWERKGDFIDLDLKIWRGGSFEDLCRTFLQSRFAGMHVRDAGILEIMVLLFLTMIPLHTDKPQRQRAFLANAYRLAKELDIVPARSSDSSDAAFLLA